MKRQPMRMDWFPRSLEVAAGATLLSLALGLWLAWLLVNLTNAFAAWEWIRTHPTAGKYVLAALVPKQR